MPAHTYSEIYLHFNWHTANNAPLLKPQVEKFVHQHIRNKCRQTPGVYFEGIGGTEDHIHLVVRIDPNLSASEVAQRMKGASSHDANEHFRRKSVAWQRGFGVVSFGART